MTTDKDKGLVGGAADIVGGATDSVGGATDKVRETTSGLGGGAAILSAEPKRRQPGPLPPRRGAC